MATDLDESMLDAARYGEVDEMISLLEEGADINACAEHSGNTACHMTSANGEEECLRALVSRGADVTVRNKAGNLPLHYAAQQKHLECLKILLACDGADVLAQNSFGKSTLTEAIASGSGEIATAVLEHESAVEERIIDGLSPSSADTVTHRFRFPAANEGEAPAIVSVRELKIEKALGGVDGQVAEDRTGLGVWASSLVLARWLAAEASTFDRKTAIELGAGCGVPSVALAALSPSARVVLTDGHPEALDNAAFNVSAKNIQQNLDDALRGSERVSVAKLDWADAPRASCDDESIVVVGADLVYCEAAANILSKALADMGAREFWYVAPDKGRAGADSLIKSLTDSPTFYHHDSREAPAQFYENPLVDVNDEEKEDGASSSNFLLYFPDLPASTFQLHRFYFNSSRIPQ